MEVALDPGVYVSALIAPKGAPAQLLDLLLEDRFQAIVSPAAPGGAHRRAASSQVPRYASPAEVRQFVAELSAIAIMAEDPPDPAPVRRDPGDDHLVALAIDAGADALVSGDRDSTDLTTAGVTVLTPRGLVDRLAASSR